MATFRVSIFLVSLLALFAWISASDSETTDSSESKEYVLTLDHSNFTDVVYKQDFILVEFYAPW